MHASIKLINQRGGRVQVEELADAACLSRKQFERRFSSWVGDSPAKFLRTVRFQRALKERSLDREGSLTRLAHTCGYYDQAHMIRDFTRLSGLTPGQYFSGQEIYSDYF
jgi:transcriptional regulator GlxA family with amidase domain